MNELFEQITDWLKEMLVSAIMNNLSGLFDTVNEQVGSIATEVGTPPANFSPGVFTMIQSISETVILPIAGIFLTFIACYELIEMVTQHNHLQELDTWMFFQWVFKTFCAVLLVTNAWNIVMGIFDVVQNVV